MNHHALIVLSALALTFAAGGAGGTPDPFEYRLDDGTGNFTIGPSQFNANMTWLNTFQAQAGRERITRVSVSFGNIFDNNGVAGSDAVTVAVLNDPNNDGNPADAVLLATGTGTWTAQASNTFLHFDLDTDAVVEGTFFVAVMMDVLQRANPARMDPQGQGAGTLSWLFYNPEPNLDDLGSSPFILRMADSPFIGAWMIRAEGTATDAGCPADLAPPKGVLNFFDLAAYLDLYNTGSPGADLAAPFGTINFFDLAAYLDLFNAGCP
jgi:hypothetical protein